MEIWPGQPDPLGATYDGFGVNFSLFSEVATRVELCLFDEAGGETRFDLPEVTSFCFHGYVPQLQPGQRYGFRVHGPWAPEHGQRCNAAKLLLDPYAKAIDGDVRWDEAVFPHRFADPAARNDADSAPFMPKAVVTNPWFDWGNDRPPRTAQERTVVYEAHVKGLTRLLSRLPAPLRGTYAGLAEPAVIEYLQRLGITAVELMPVHQFVHDQHLLERGLRNYWGYNSIGYFAPHHDYGSSGARGQQVQEFRQMVKTLHQAGIEVILDVVYNRTAEGNHLGPTLSFRGIDNAAYYRLAPEDRRRYVDYTGCGNTLNMMHPRTIQLIMDSLRYWVLDMHVDGFRFDLAAALARELHDVDRLSAFFDVIHQDPVISQVKLIAEPWDLGEGGYQVGNFPVGWAEWNGKYRDTVRRYWRGDAGQLSELGYRLTGSSDLYEPSGRRPYASVNFVTAHDGFTLADLVSYEEKKNEDNGEGNRDGTDDNLSWNGGAEGPTDDAKIIALRERQMRNFLATLFLSQGIPMLCGGDEIARTQRGNNNAYCQDNDVSWYAWPPVGPLFEFTQRLIRLRLAHPVFHRRTFFHGRRVLGATSKDLSWFGPDGQEMSDHAWGDAELRCLGLRLAGDAIEEVDDMGQPIRGDTFVVLLNAGDQSVPFTLPAHDVSVRWEIVLDTRDWAVEDRARAFAPGEAYDLDGRSVAVLRLRPRSRASEVTP